MIYILFLYLIAKNAKNLSYNQAFSGIKRLMNYISIRLSNKNIYYNLYDICLWINIAYVKNCFYYLLSYF